MTSNNPEFDAWANRLVIGLHSYRQSKWEMADLLLEGMDRFGEQMFWQVVPDLHLTEHTIKNWLCLAKKFKPVQRHMALSFSHHDAVCGLAKAAQRDAVLTVAKLQGWTVDATRARVQAFLKGTEHAFDPTWFPDGKPVNLKSFHPDAGIEPFQSAGGVAPPITGKIIGGNLAIDRPADSFFVALSFIESIDITPEALISIARTGVGVERIAEAAVKLQLLAFELEAHQKLYA